MFVTVWTVGLTGPQVNSGVLCVGQSRRTMGCFIEAGGKPLPFAMSPMGFLLGFPGVGV